MGQALRAQDLVWAKQAGGTNIEQGRGIAVDGSGNSYMTGRFADSATFGSGETNETTLTSAGLSDIFVSLVGGLRLSCGGYASTCDDLWMYRQNARYAGTPLGLIAALSLCLSLPMGQALRAQDLV